DTNTLTTNLNDRPFTNTVYFDPTEIAVQWQWLSTNLATFLPATNFLYLTDDWGERTNIQLRVNGTTQTRNTYKPVNYNFFEGFPFPGTPSPGWPGGTVFDPTMVTNQDAGY